MTREEARAKGHKRYESTNPCRVCAGIIRYTSNKGCCGCALAAWQQELAKRETRKEVDLINPLILSLNAEGKTVREIADALNYAGYKNRANNAFSVQLIRKTIIAAGHVINKPEVYAPHDRTFVTLVKDDKDREARLDFTPDELGKRAWQ